MKKIRLLFYIGVLSSLTGIPSIAQISSSYDEILSLLRGTWKYDTYEESIKIEFISDTEVYVHDTLRTYSISGNAFLVEINGETYAYHYILNENTLTVTDPAGLVTFYERKDFGFNEKLLDGSFFLFEDTICDSYFLFEKFHKFRFSVLNETDSSILRSGNGYFRIEGNDILLTFSDGTTGKAQVRYRDENGKVTGIRYDYLSFDIQYPDMTDPFPPIDPGPDYPPTPPPPPPPPPPPGPDPPYSPCPPSPPEKISHPAPVKSVEDKKREDGSIRPKQGEDRPVRKRP